LEREKNYHIKHCGEKLPEAFTQKEIARQLITQKEIARQLQRKECIDLT